MVRGLIIWSLTLAACLPPEVPLAGKACSAQHPCGPDLQCCAGVCQASCERCPERTCALERAVRCEAGPRVCLDGCWEPCPACLARCQDPEATRCQLEGGETWLCQAQEVCVLRQAAGLRADCHVPPPWCAAGSGCACLNAADALYPACDPWEACLDGTGGLLTCRSLLVDAGQPGDASGVDRPRPDAGAADAGALDHGTSVADAAWPDAGAADGAELDGASWQDGQGGADAAVSPDAGWPGDAAVAADAGLADAAGPCGPLAPDCFAPVASGPSGETCCALVAVAASCDGVRWQCPAGTGLAARCHGYGDTCSRGEDPACAPADACLWSWDDSQGGLVCAGYGPPAPCVDGDWQCVAGSTAPAACP